MIIQSHKGNSNRNSNFNGHLTIDAHQFEIQTGNSFQCLPAIITFVAFEGTVTIHFNTLRRTVNSINKDIPFFDGLVIARIRLSLLVERKLEFSIRRNLIGNAGNFGGGDQAERNGWWGSPKLLKLIGWIRHIGKLLYLKHNCVGAVFNKVVV